MRQASRYTGQILVTAECRVQNMRVPLSVEESPGHSHMSK